MKTNLGYLAVALVVPAVAILLHELGHFAAHAAFGYEVNRLWYAGVTTGDTPAGVDARLADGLSFAAGTAVSLALLGLGVVSIVVVGMNPPGLALVMFECVRAVVGVVTSVGSAGLAALAGRFGELRYVASALGGGPVLGGALAWIELALPFAGLVYVLRRAERGGRLYPSAVVLAGLVGGIVLWLVVVGPRVLPA